MLFRSPEVGYKFSRLEIAPATLAPPSPSTLQVPNPNLSSLESPFLHSVKLLPHQASHCPSESPPICPPPLNPSFSTQAVPFPPQFSLPPHRFPPSSKLFLDPRTRTLIVRATPESARTALPRSPLLSISPKLLFPPLVLFPTYSLGVHPHPLLFYSHGPLSLAIPRSGLR